MACNGDNEIMNVDLTEGKPESVLWQGNLSVKMPWRLSVTVMRLHLFLLHLRSAAI